MQIRYTIEYLAHISRVDAWHGEHKVGNLQWANDAYWTEEAGEILEVHVAKLYRRQGIATAMLAKAREQDSRVHHSSNRTPLGQLWAMSTGDRLPKWKVEPPYSEEAEIKFERLD